MSIKNATIEEKANIYFDGKVTSRTVYLPDGQRLNLGFMVAGSYQFSTTQKERMEVLQEKLTVLLPGETEWQEVAVGQSFEVLANSQFEVKTEGFADYQCFYL